VTDTGSNRFVLEARELECVRDDRTLFSNLEFRIEPGQALLLEGRNGSGKTSLLRILCGIRMPDEGSVLWAGEDIFRLRNEYHEHVTYVGHKDGIKQDLTALENLTVARAFGPANPDLGLEAALDKVDLYGFEDVPTRNLSAGQQRRLALARLLVTRTTLWILDEPFTSLDRHGIGIVERLLHEHVAQGGMAAFTTHHRVTFDDRSVVRLNLSR
jgi:heme exporter protein A